MTPDSRSRPQEHECPWCGYNVVGVANGTPCPECGGDFGPAARAVAHVREALQHLWARVLFLASPGIGFIAAIVVFTITRRYQLALVTPPLCLIGISVLLLWYTSGRAGSRKIGRALLLGPILGVGYFLIATLAALAVVFTIVILANDDVRGPSWLPPGWLLAPLSIAVVIGILWLIARVLRRIGRQPTR